MPNPPYAVPTTSFRFAALATLAGKAPLGGRREVALAVYLAARLADDTLPERGIPPEARAERARHARSWLASIAVPAPVRAATGKMIDATAGEARATGATLQGVINATASYLDAAARAELDRLTAALAASDVRP